MHSTSPTPFAVCSSSARSELLRSRDALETVPTADDTDSYPATLEDRFLASIDGWMYRHPILGSFAAFGSLAAVVLVVAFATVMSST